MDTPRPRFPIAAALAAGMALAFVAGMWWIMHERAAAGEGYDAYSSYRSDPIGLSALHDALATLPGHSVQRNHQDLTRLRKGEDTTLLFGGAWHSPDPVALVEAIEGFVASGGRLVIAFQSLGMSASEYADYRDAYDADSPVTPDDDEAVRETGEDGDPEEDTRSIRARWADPGLVWIDDAWGFRYVVRDWPGAPPREPRDAVRTIDDTTLPARLAWYATEYFEPKTPEWRTLYEVDGHAVLMERRWGKGAIVVASDTYLFSNEGLAFDTAPALIAWTLGGNRRIVIDETTHNVRQEVGIMGLIRRYRLSGLLVAGAVIALLYIWRQAVPLVPRHSLAREREVAQAQSMRDAYAGLVRLLARSVPRKKLIPAAVVQWRRALPHSARADASRLDRVQAVAARADAGDDPVAAYREIVQRLKERT